MDRKMQNLLTLNRMHHPKAEVNKMYVPRQEGTRGKTNPEMSFKAATIGLNYYLESLMIGCYM